MLRHYDFPLEYDVPIPPKQDVKRRYPFKALTKKGMSFMVPCDPMDLRKLWNSLTRSAAWASTKTGWKFTMRQILGGIRVWRIQ